MATPRSTQGNLFVDGIWACFTMELPLGDGLPGSALAPGSGQIVLAPSPHFLADPDPWWQPYSARMPHILGWPGRSLIMLHAGNVPANTDGCVLLGQARSQDMLERSRPAFAALYPLLAAACGSPDGCPIDIFNPPAVTSPPP